MEVSHTAQYFQAKYSILWMPRESSLSGNPDGLSIFLRGGLARTRWFVGHFPDIHQRESTIVIAFYGGHFARAVPRHAAGSLTNGRSVMRSKDLMSPDLVSEIVLLGVGTLILISLLLFIVAAFTRT